MRLAEAVNGCLAPEQSAKVSFCLPDDFAACLVNLIIQDGLEKPHDAPAEKRTRGYKIKSHYVEVSPAEVQAREERALSIVAGKLRSGS